jgi:uncharacterized protein (DUF488 family)
VAAQIIPLCTIGYEGRTPDELTAALRMHRVSRVVDVRQLPLSRKRGFSKTALTASLSACGIGYVSLRELGTPKPVRDDYRRTRDFGSLAKQYHTHIAKQDPAVEMLYDMAAAETCCLFCFERDPKLCHRSLLADVVVRRNGRQFVVQHI